MLFPTVDFAEDNVLRNTQRQNELLLRIYTRIVFNAEWKFWARDFSSVAGNFAALNAARIIWLLPFWHDPHDAHNAEK